MPSQNTRTFMWVSYSVSGGKRQEDLPSPLARGDVASPKEVSPISAGVEKSSFLWVMSLATQLARRKLRTKSLIQPQLVLGPPFNLSASPCLAQGWQVACLCETNTPAQFQTC